MSPLRPWRLAAQIWGLALLTQVVVLLSLTAMLWMSRQPPPHSFGRLHDYIVREMAMHAGEPGGLQAAVDRASEQTADRYALFSADGVLLAATRGAEPPTLTAEQLAALDRGERPDKPPVVVVPLRAEDGLAGYGVVHLGMPPPLRPGLSTLAVVLAVLAGLSLLLARRLLGPLRRLVATAQAFGAGDVHVRVGLPPRGPLGLLGSVFDEMAGRVAELLRSQRELLANVSHELRTPLARLRVALELAAESDGEAARTELTVAEDDLAQLERMVEDVLRAASLDLASLRASDTHTALRRQRLDVAALVLLTGRRFAAAWSRCRVSIDVPDRPIDVEGDPELLRRALDNLLDNARKYSEPGAPITIRAATDDDHVLLEVIDLGIGIDPADQPQVFTPFFRTDRSRTRATGGVGLGLTLVQRIATAHGGTVALESEPGRGTRVTLRLPRASRGAVEAA
ncbi:sensor histidine kinase [Nannocystis radixulma]|uniref:histidine kinase n=1 Tax=Nannocystis radixulma TaxID=2995305 RepID=A0ABT5BFT6_9BACT|nr:ATP-binding protein [Nannocystis radixulma]MDC0672389.1 ATP-binding protein [Nannocystis radixulma]